MRAVTVIGGAILALLHAALMAASDKAHLL